MPQSFKGSFQRFFFFFFFFFFYLGLFSIEFFIRSQSQPNLELRFFVSKRSRYLVRFLLYLFLLNMSNITLPTEGLIPPTGNEAAPFQNFTSSSYIAGTCYYTQQLGIMGVLNEKMATIVLNHDLHGCQMQTLLHRLIQTVIRRLLRFSSKVLPSPIFQLYLQFQLYMLNVFQQ